MTTKIKILVLAANPVNTSQLRLGEEVRSIQQALKQAKYRGSFELISQWAVRTSDLSQALLEHKPQIVHFSGHGQGSPTGTGDRSSADSSRDIGIESESSASMHEGLVLEDDQGRAKLVSTNALAGLFELFQNEVRCVVLNACYSERQATAIYQHIDCVVGMSKAIGDRAAIQFAAEFYKVLATGRSIEFAYNFARKGLDLDGIPESLTPVLRNRRGTEDPFKITTAIPDSNPRVTVPEPQPKPSMKPSSDLPTASRKNIKWFAGAGVALTAVLVGLVFFVSYRPPLTTGKMILSEADPHLAITASGGAKDGNGLKLSKDCDQSNPECRWTSKYRMLISDKDFSTMLISDKDPSLAIAITEGVVHRSTSLVLSKNCYPDNPDCTWIYSNDQFISAKYPHLAINAYGGAQEGTELKLYDVSLCNQDPNATNNSDLGCKWNW